MDENKYSILKEEIDQYLLDNYVKVDFILREYYPTSTRHDKNKIEKSSSFNNSKVETIKLLPSFQQVLFNFIDSKGLDDVEVYKKSDIDRKLFSKIRSNEYYNPRKSTVIRFIFGLELNLYEANKLLASAGYSLSHSIKKDVIIEYFIIHKMYDIYELYEMLYSYNEEL